MTLPEPTSLEKLTLMPLERPLPALKVLLLTQALGLFTSTPTPGPAMVLPRYELLPPVEAAGEVPYHAES